ncbi:MAG: serpin family protein [Treponema sp.]|nr:serpin family protein [Treponema sp.]
MNKFAFALVFTMSIFGFVLLGCDSEIQTQDVTEPNPGIQYADLMQDIIAQSAESAELDDQFRIAAADFSLDLFRAVLSDEKNSIISPTSVLLALAMAANGADGNTLTQMEQVIGGGMSISKLNTYLYSFANSLSSQPKEFLSISNSIWFKNLGFTPNIDFLQTNADYFGADAFAAPFDEETVNDINAWISEATDGLIEQMLDSIPEEAVLYLINTILFDAEWAQIYNENSIRSEEFTNHNSQTQPAEFMYSSENLFFQGDNETGFIKPYYSGRYSFAAILPEVDIDIFDYVDMLSGEKFLNLMGNAYSARVVAALPKFDYEYEVTMNDALIAMGIEDAFCKKTADLSRMGNWIYGDLWINKVMHKANIAVDERGTKAGAATVIEVGGITSVPPPPKYVILDRPFVYAIIDNDTNLPIFMGTLLSVE